MFCISESLISPSLLLAVWLSPLTIGVTTSQEPTKSTSALLCSQPLNSSSNNDDDDDNDDDNDNSNYYYYYYFISIIITLKQVLKYIAKTGRHRK